MEASQQGRVLVVGSINTDLVARTERLPRAGQTVLSHSFEVLPGGKGANQAIAAARMGAAVAMIGCVGHDAYGTQRVNELRAERIDCSGMQVTDQAPTGTAMITVSAAGENSIVVAAGSNGLLTPANVRAHEALFRDCDVLVCQLETPSETIHAALMLARQFGKTTILNPGPATQPLSEDWLPLIDYLVPNESEATILAGLDAIAGERAVEAAIHLHRSGVRNVIVTLGARGVSLVSDAQPGGTHFPAHVVRAVDTTAAGDTFVGVLAAALAARGGLPEALARAQTAASLCVQRHGAQPSIPTIHELLSCESTAVLAS